MINLPIIYILTYKRARKEIRGTYSTYPVMILCVLKLQEQNQHVINKQEQKQVCKFDIYIYIYTEIFSAIPLSPKKKKWIGAYARTSWCHFSCAYRSIVAVLPRPEEIEFGFTLVYCSRIVALFLSASCIFVPFECDTPCPTPGEGTSPPSRPGSPWVWTATGSWLAWGSTSSSADQRGTRSLVWGFSTALTLRPLASPRAPHWTHVSPWRRTW
jgi:hypothetical protein